MQPKKWILFDIGGVLEIVDDDNWQIAFADRWRRHARLTTEQYRARLDAVALPAIDREVGTETAYWDVVGDALDLGPSDVRRMRTDMWDSYCGTLNVELMDFIRALPAHVGVAILSNSVDGAREEEERRHGFSAVFDPISYSHELGVAKPEPESYEIALRRMGAAASEVLFVDDHETAVEGARLVGIRSILHRDNAVTMRAIEGFLSELP